jgi:hypothetical protein
MLLYENDKMRTISAASYINTALATGSLAIYASVNAAHPGHVSQIAAEIKDYNENIKKGNLIIISLKSFYESVLDRDLSPFEDLKVVLEEIIAERISIGRSPEILVVADCADNLSQNEKFDECVFVEKWWQDTHSDWQKNNVLITIICPHPGRVLEGEGLAHRKSQLSKLHTVTLKSSR